MWDRMRGDERNMGSMGVKYGHGGLERCMW